MPLDSIFLSALTDELSEKLTGAKIDKVQQPERDQLLLSLRSRNGNFRLLLSAGTGTARVQITEQRYEQPQEPPMFCMLMRKHLVGAWIEKIEQPGNDRLLILELGGYDELGDEIHKKLIVELMGRAANILLVGADGRIIDCLRRVTAGDGVHRNLLPGMFYALPPGQTKPDFFAAGEEKRLELWRNADGRSVDKWMGETFSGISPLIVRELCYRCFGQASPLFSELTEEDRARFPDGMEALCDSVSHREFLPVLLTQNGEMKDFAFMHIRQYGNEMEQTVCGGFSELLDTFYSARDKAESMRRKSRDLLKKVKTVRDRTERTLIARQTEWKKSENRETYREWGDIIMSNLYRMKKGETVLEAENFYQEDLPVVQIPLDPLKTPQQNAARYYREYTKAKTAEEHLTALIAKNETELTYLNSVLDEISRAESERDLADIRRELTETGYLRKPKGGKPDRQKPQGPMEFVSGTGYEILVGRSNGQNDQLTLKTARRTDIWLHTQKIHGSHVIIRAEDTTPDDETLYEAACLAAYYSQARDGGKVPVDYALAKFVKKPKGGMPGMVIYTDYQTIAADSSDAILKKLSGNQRRNME